VGREAAALAAGIMALSGPFASLASMQNVLSGAAWVPLALWGFLRALESGRWTHRILSVLALAVVLITGEAASVMAYAVLAPALALGRRPAGEEGAARASRVLGGLLLVGGLAAAVAAVQILPAAELLRSSPRGAGLSVAEALKWSLQPARLLEAWMPGLLGDPTRLSPDAWWGRWLFEGGYPFLLSVYVGAAPLLLAATGLASRSARRPAAVLGAIAAFFVLLALGARSPLYPLLQAVLPPLRQVRYPERFLIGAVVALALLAALGLEHLLRSGRGTRAWRWFALAAVLAFAAATTLAAEPTLVDGFLRGTLRLPAAVLQGDSGAVVRAAVLSSFLWTFAETTALAAGAALLALGGRRIVPAAAWGIVAACGVSLAIATSPARSTAASGWLDAPSPLAGWVGHGPAAPRVHHAPRPDSLSIWGTTDEQIWGFRFDRFTYSLQTGHADRVPTILDAATDRLDLAVSEGLSSRLASLPLPDRLRILRVAHAGYLLAYEDLDDPGLLPGPVLDGLSRPALRVYRIAEPFDRARFVPRARPPKDPGDLAQSLLDPAFDPSREVLLDGVPEPVEGPAPDASAVVRVLQDDPERVRIELEAPGPGYLVLADSFAPGWRARLDGTTAPLRRANGLFRAVAVPAGRHVVEMVYAPKSVYLGAGLSACGLILTGLWGLRRRDPGMRRIA
jgi:hypothetical protein